MLINLIIFRSLRIGDTIGGDVVKGETIDSFHSRDRWPQWGGETIRII
jgi:hypothetical protein